MRVALVVAGPWPAFRGSQVLVGHVARGLRERGHAVDVVTYGARFGQRPGLRPSRTFLDAWLTARLAWLVRAGGVDVVHAHNYEAAVAGLAVRALTGCRVVYHGHSAMAEELPTYATSPVARRALALAGRWLDGAVPRRADFCIAVTDDLAARLRGVGVDPAALASIAPVAAPDEIPPGSPRRVSDGQAVVCYAGNLDGYQNLDLLLAAFARVRREIGHARLELVTHADAGARAARLAARGLGEGVEITVARSYDAVRERLASATIAVSPRAERSGFPMKILNYMAAGTAIVACAGSAKGLVDGHTACIVPDDDPAALAGAITGLLRDPARRARLGDAAHAAVAGSHAWEQVLDRLEAIYRQVLTPARPAPARLPLTERST